ncbi:MAG TPA: rhodanese-like domain-containing protein [Bryobacteraceae bacterium]|nr:rhodanese-like domain-containing protein [Bryobacteraceae bacterium]
MYFEQFYLGCLAHASYMIGSEGLAAVVDPQRDIGIYVEEAARHGFRIAYVIETHLHADFVSGHQELAATTGAKIYLGHKAGAKFPHIAVHDGDRLEFGQCCLEFLETPGHTVESVSILATDLERSAEPFAVFTGDTLFIGDVGRPDLSGDLTPQQLASMLYDSLQTKLLRLPDAVQVFPAHGAGSLCGRQMSSERSSTIGKERATNYALRAKTREEFVDLLTSELPERPGYFALDVEINRSGAAPLESLPEIPALEPAEVVRRQQAGAIVLDTRSSGQFGSAHIPGALQIGLAGQYASWAGILLGLGQELILVAEDEEKVHESRLRLARVGIEKVTGYLRDGMASWSAAGMPLQQLAQITVDDLAVLANDHDLQIVDVRRPSEWDDGHVEHAVLKPLNRLESSLGDLDRHRTTAVYCKGGYRSSIASSILQRAGFEQVVNVIGGFDAWRAANLPVVQVGCHAAEVTS